MENRYILSLDWYTMCILYKITLQHAIACNYTALIITLTLQKMSKLSLKQCMFTHIDCMCCVYLCFVHGTDKNRKFWLGDQPVDVRFTTACKLSSIWKIYCNCLLCVTFVFGFSSNEFSPTYICCCRQRNISAVISKRSFWTSEWLDCRTSSILF